MTDPQIIFVDDEEHLRIAAAQTFDLEDIPCLCVDHGQAALDVIDKDFAGVVVSDIRMPVMDGVTLLQRIMQIDPSIPVVLVTGHGEVALAVQCLKDGAYDFLEKPTDPARLVASVRRALGMRQLTLENRLLRAEAQGSMLRARLHGRSASITQTRARIAAIAATDADVLITGATGTGKEIAARAIHQASQRANGAFVHVNCAALPETLMESELFGAEAGAFPGAVRARIGKLEHARKGTLCLDEIDSLPLPLQAKLLDVLHNRCVTRLGSNEVIPLDLRVIALSKTNLEQAVAQGRFRADLLYRLNVVALDMPVLDARREDIPVLFLALLRDAATRYEREIPHVDGAVLSQLAMRNWPGNVRELRNAAERFVLGLSAQTDFDTSAPTSLADRMAAHEKALIAAAIAANGGRLKETYESLGLSRKALYDKMQRYGLARADFADDG